MNIRFLVTAFAIFLLPLHSPGAGALTIRQFADICESSPDKCSEHPILQAYVGGALDLLATLDERTDYLKTIYCKKSDDLFDVPAIIQFMERRSEKNDTDNAMLLLVRYFEEHGGCEHE